jgi:hypothetical protein
MTFLSTGEAKETFCSIPRTFQVPVRSGWVEVVGIAFQERICPKELVEEALLSKYRIS